MRCGSREPVYLVVSQHLYDPTGVVSEETPATACVFVDVPRRRIARTLSVPSLRTGRPYKLVSYIKLHGELRAPV